MSMLLRFLGWVSERFIAASEFVDDVVEWLLTDLRWSTIRNWRLYPPTTEFDPPDTSRAPFHMPPDVER